MAKRIELELVETEITPEEEAEYNRIFEYMERLGRMADTWQCFISEAK